MEKIVECYDVGGTKIRGALIEKEQHKIIKTSFCQTIKNDPNKFIKQIKRLSNLLRSGVSSKNNIIAVSMGLPGPVENGVLIEAPPMKINSKLHVVHELGKYFKEPIFAVNDLKAAVRAELQFGIGKTVKNFYLLTISTGIGSGLVIDGKVVEGFYGEFGHTILERDSKKANECGCGRMGCWCAMSSGHGIEMTIKKELKRKLTNKNFFRLYNSDVKMKEIVKRIRDYNAHGIGNMLNAFSVDVIVLMGSIALSQFNIVIPSPEEIKKYTINRVPEIVPTKLGDNIGLFGTFVFACKKLREM